MRSEGTPKPRHPAGLQLFVIRHAAAVPRRRGARDSSRPLTADGRAKFRRAVHGLERLDVVFDRVLHSDKRRAVETAELLAPLVKGQVSATATLSRGPAAPLLAEIRGRRVAVVGHEPHLGALVAWLVTGDRSQGAKFALKKGGVIVLAGAPHPASMRLVAALPPKVLRRIAKG